MKIKDVELLKEITGNEKIPVSNGSEQPATITVNLILEKVPEPDLSEPLKTRINTLEDKVSELENKEIPAATIETVGGVKKFEIMDLQDKSNIDNLYKAYNTLVEQMVNAGVAEDTRFVDLGLPSGTLWATCNLGSDSIEDPGLFFLWGDIEGYYYKDGQILDLYGEISNKRFLGTQYKWYDGTDAYESGTHEGLVKYYIEEDEYGEYIYKQNKLLAEDDASTNYNSNFSIPTSHLVTELLKNTNKSYVDINGKTLLCCESIHNNNKLYLPKIGHLVDTSMGDEDLYFWPNTINYNTQTSCYVYKIVPSGPVDQENYYLIGRHFGLPIRYVKKP